MKEPGRVDQSIVPSDLDLSDFVLRCVLVVFFERRKLLFGFGDGLIRRGWIDVEDLCPVRSRLSYPFHRKGK